eukprot:362132-Chlamydomonas_euryale.AAC.6
MAFFLARQRASFIGKMIRTSHPLSNLVSVAFCFGCCLGSQRRQGGIIMSCRDNVHALFDEDRFKSITSLVFSDDKSSFLQNRQVFPPHLHSVLSSRTTPSWPISRPRRAHPLTVSTLSQPLVCSLFHFARNRFGCSFWLFRSIWLATKLELPPRRCLISFHPYAALLRLWHYAFFFNHVQVHETFVYGTGWMDSSPPPIVCGSHTPQDPHTPQACVLLLAVATLCR